MDGEKKNNTPQNDFWDFPRYSIKFKHACAKM